MTTSTGSAGTAVCAVTTAIFPNISNGANAVNKRDISNLNLNTISDPRYGSRVWRDPPAMADYGSSESLESLRRDHFLDNLGFVFHYKVGIALDHSERLVSEDVRNLK